MEFTHIATPIAEDAAAPDAPSIPLSHHQQQRQDNIRAIALSYAHATQGNADPHVLIKASQKLEAYLLGNAPPLLACEMAAPGTPDADDRPPYQQRVSSEASDLAAKIHNLSNFISSGRPFYVLDADERTRMTLQLECMESYYSILEQRIQAWSLLPVSPTQVG